MKAIWKDKVLAESGDTIIIEGNHYFPPESLKTEFFRTSSKLTTCHWKGLASYYDIVIDSEVNEDSAWYYPEPKEAAKEIGNYVSFWKGVKIAQ